MPVFNVFNYSDHASPTQHAVCSNPIAEVAASCAASNPALTFPRIRNNSAYAMDIDEVRNTLEGMTSNAVFGDLAVLRDRYFSPSDRYHADILCRLEDDYRKWEVERIKKLISSKTTIRYRIEVK